MGLSVSPSVFAPGFSDFLDVGSVVVQTGLRGKQTGFSLQVKQDRELHLQTKLGIPSVIISPKARRHH